MKHYSTAVAIILTTGPIQCIYYDTNYYLRLPFLFFENSIQLISQLNLICIEKVKFIGDKNNLMIF